MMFSLTTLKSDSKLNQRIINSDNCARFGLICLFSPSHFLSLHEVRKQQSCLQIGRLFGTIPFDRNYPDKPEHGPDKLNL